MSVINEVKTWLKSQHIIVPVDWVEACIDFLKQEFQVQCDSGSLKILKKCVFEQWLAADLQEIGVPSLPSNISVTEKTTLQGCYALQVNAIRDVGKSAYSQLKQLSGISNENSEVSATPKPFVPEWEAKPTRMLMMNMTDGINYVQGMEYKHISYLSDDLPVGVKVLIQGPIDCRFGILLLTPEKIRVLGGEVEDLVDKYSKQEVLREALQLRKENDEATMDHDSFEAEISSGFGNQINQVQKSRRPPVQQDVRQQNPNSALPSHASVTAGCPTYPQSHSQISGKFPDQNCNGVSSTENIDFDSFGDDDEAFVNSIDYNALEQIEKESMSQAISKNYDDDDDGFDISEDEDVYLEVMALQENSAADTKAPTRTLPEQPKTSPSIISNVTTPAQSSSYSKLTKLSTPESLSPVYKKSSISTPNGKQTLFTSSSSPCGDHPASSSISATLTNQQRSPRDSAEVKPYSSISSVLQNLDSSSEFEITVKACISNVLSKLECSPTLGWQLTAQLKDETGTIEASIHDKVLEKFVGIPAKEMLILQTQAQNNVETKKKIMEAIMKCKTKLKTLNCLMDVKFSPHLPKPCVIKCIS